MAIPLHGQPQYLFVVMLLLFLIILVVVFVPSYQAMYNGTRNFIHWLGHVNGALMTMWYCCFTTEIILALFLTGLNFCSPSSFLEGLI
jgi:hypothetical protein